MAWRYVKIGHVKYWVSIKWRTIVGSKIGCSRFCYCLDPRCQGVPDGFFRKDLECTSYFQCSSGTYKEHHCESGRYFDMKSSQCQETRPSECVGKYLVHISFIANNISSKGYYTNFVKIIRGWKRTYITKSRWFDFHIW